MTSGGDSDRTAAAAPASAGTAAGTAASFEDVENGGNAPLRTAAAMGAVAFERC